MCKEKETAKKTIALILLFIFFMGTIGCGKTSKKSGGQEAAKSEFDLKTALNVADTYMKYIMKNDVENAKKLCSTDLVEKSKMMPPEELIIRGYNFTDVSEMGKSGFFKTKVIRSSMTKPYACLDEYSLKVKKVGNEYRVVETKDVVMKEVFSDNNSIRIKNKDEVKTNLVYNMESLPNYMVPKKDKSNLNKEVVDKSDYGPMTIGFGGNMVGMSTKGENSFTALITIDETLAVQGEKDQQNKGEQENAAEPQLIKEKPIGKNLSGIDIVKGDYVDFITFSQDEKFILTQYRNKNKNNYIRVYYIESGELIPFDFEKQFPIEKTSVRFIGFDKDTLNFEVAANSGSDKSASMMIGKWQLNLKDFKANKM